MAHEAQETPSFSEPTLQILRRALQRLEHLDFDDTIGMFSAVRAAVHAIAPVDAFYVGIYHGWNGMIIPYTYYHDRFVRPDYSHFRSNGLSAWIKAHGTTYRLGQDDGRLLAQGMPLGDGDIPTLDAVVVPIQDSSRPIGLISVQSERPGIYSTEHVRAFEWLAAALARFMSRHEELSFDFQVLQAYPELDPATEDPALQTFHEISRRLAEVQRSAEALRELAATADSSLIPPLDEHIHLVLRQQAELAILLGQHATASDHPPGWSKLTRRQQQIATLVIDESATNAMIADRLCISEATVKSHLRHVFRVLGLHSRDELRHSSPSH